MERAETPKQAVEDAAMVVPDYRGACVSNIVPALLEYRGLGEGWIPDRALEADQVVLLVIDGLGWNQLAERLHLAPVMGAAEGQPITTVAPTTTSAALASITTGAAPGEHGLVGYRIRTGGETLNALRWTTETGDARERVIPAELQVLPPFGNRGPVVVTKGEFVRTGFTQAHLSGTDFRGYSTIATMVHEVACAAAEGQRFVYAYYDGLDRVGHERGHDAGFDAEFAFVDQLVRRVRDALPSDAVLLVTADHGQVHTGDNQKLLDAEMLRPVYGISGEPRFVWLHAERGSGPDVLAAAGEAHGDDAWVLSVEEVIDRCILGPRVTAEARSRLGEVALLAKGTVALIDPAAPPSILVGRHGSLTADEVYVPLLCL